MEIEQIISFHIKIYGFIGLRYPIFFFFSMRFNLSESIGSQPLTPRDEIFDQQRRYCGIRNAGRTKKNIENFNYISECVQLRSHQKVLRCLVRKKKKIRSSSREVRVPWSPTRSRICRNSSGEKREKREVRCWNKTDR